MGFVKNILLLYVSGSFVFLDAETNSVHLERDIVKYDTFRPNYPIELVELLEKKTTSDRTGRLLDLGCGSGQLTFLLAPYYKEVVAIDIDEKMIEDAKKKAEIENINNISWFHKCAEDVSIATERPFDGITIATAFHWMDRPVVLNNSYQLLKSGKSIAIFCAQSWWISSSVWQKEVIDLIQDFLGPNKPYYPPAYVHNSSHETLMYEAGFENIQTFSVTTPYLWSLNSIFGYLYSTAYCKPSHFGNQLQEFEKGVESIFLKYHPSGEYLEEFPFHILIGFKP